MRFKLISLTLVAAALAVPAATAAPGRDKPSKPERHAKACHGKAKVAVLLKGTLANDPAAGETSFQLTVQRANRWGRPYKKASQPLSINVDAKTRYSKNDQPATLDALAQNDQVVVQSKLRRCDLKAATPDALPALTARRVVVQSPEPAEESSSSGS
jgi:hypothetical protein